MILDILPRWLLATYQKKGFKETKLIEQHPVSSDPMKIEGPSLKEMYIKKENIQAKNIFGKQ